jgi:hypothetical protein
MRLAVSPFVSDIMTAADRNKRDSSRSFADYRVHWTALLCMKGGHCVEQANEDSVSRFR